MKEITITIDNKPIKTFENANLLQVARDNGFDIPGLCYHKKLTPTGACRLCIVKIKGSKGLTASCGVSVKNGMEVIAFDEELEHNRKMTLEHLLAEHNEDYDFSYHDELRELTIRYGLNLKRSLSKLQHIEYPKDYSSPVLTYDVSKCIRCFRCIKACDEVQGKNVLSMAERGTESYIVAGTGVWGNSECDGCGECIQLCPTGAIVEKAHRNDVDIRNIDKKVQTTCPYCGVGCQIELWVKDNRIIRSNGVEGVSPNDGRLCVKGRFGYEFVGHPDRLTKPLIRKNGKLVESSWDEALTLIAEKFNAIKQQYSAEALAGYASAKCTNEDNYIFQKFIRIAFGNNNVDYCTRLCHASTVTAMLRSIGDGAGSNSIEDFEKTDLLLVTGNNIIETHPITATYVKRGKRRGMQIIVIDPKWTPLVKYSDLWLQPRLGTDVALLNGLINVVIQEKLYDETFIENRIHRGREAFNELVEITKKYTPEFCEKITNVPAEKIVRAARMYANAANAMIATGMGMSQQVTGTNNVFSLLNLCLICGKIGKELNGINPPRGQNNVQGATDVGCSPVNYPGYIPVTNEENRRKVAAVWNVDFEKLSPKPGLTTIEIINAAHEGKIKAMYIMGENPMLTDPNLNHTEEALKKLDFLVVQDIFETETTRFAHVVLPASSFAEKDGTFVNSDRRVLRVRKAVEMPGEAREDWKIIVSIAEKMGYNIGKYNSASEIFDEIAMVTPILRGINYERLEKGSIQWPCPEPHHPGTATLYLDKFNTNDGKAKLFPVEYVEQSEKASDEYPFILNSGRILYQYHSATMTRRVEALNHYAPSPYILIHPNDAAKNNFTDGEQVKIASTRGETISIIRISDEVAEGELFMPWHYWESLVNKLTRDEMDPLSKIAPFKLSACRLEKI